MLKSCSYCGRYHERKYICPKKPKRKETDTAIIKFRNTQAWRRKSREIKERDGFMCQVCKFKKHNTMFQYNSSRISTHHIIPIEADWNKRLDENNLITLCSYHHEMAEKGAISKRELIKIVAL